MSIRQNLPGQTELQVSQINQIKTLAEKGDAKAQYNLALMYCGSHFVEQDYAEGLKWLNLATAQGLEQAIEYHNKVITLMTPEQITEGKRRAAEFVFRKSTMS